MEETTIGYFSHLSGYPPLTKNFSALMGQKYGGMILIVHNFKAITLTSNTKIYTNIEGKEM